MTKQELNKIIRDIKSETNTRVSKDPDSHMPITAKVAIAVLQDVYREVPN